MRGSAERAGAERAEADGIESLKAKIRTHLQAMIEPGSPTPNAQELMVSLRVDKDFSGFLKRYGISDATVESAVEEVQAAVRERREASRDRSGVFRIEKDGTPGDISGIE